MLSVKELTHEFDGQTLFKDVNLEFKEGNCYGIIGANGAGKSTLLKFLSGQREPTKGEIFLDKNARMSVLEQDHFKFDEYYVTDVVIMGNPRLYEIMKEKDELYNKPDFSEADGERAAELEGEFAELDGWEAETEVLQLLNGLGVDKSNHYTQMKNLNGRDKVKVLLAKALFGIPAVKGVEFGAGFGAARMRGSQNNDPFIVKDGKILTKTNNSGGILGGITNGMPVVFRVAIKPTPSIAIPQKTVDLTTCEETELTIKGRHDPCIALRAVSVVEAVAALVILDMIMEEK